MLSQPIGRCSSCPSRTCFIFEIYQGYKINFWRKESSLFLLDLKRRCQIVLFKRIKRCMHVVRIRKWSRWNNDHIWRLAIKRNGRIIGRFRIDQIKYWKNKRKKTSREFIKWVWRRSGRLVNYNPPRMRCFDLCPQF